MFRALRTRNYRLYFAGGLVSLCGTWMQVIGRGWLVVELSGGNGLAVGLEAALETLPMLLLGMWGGVLADRFDKRRALLGTQIGFFVVAAVLATVVLTGHASLPAVYALTLAQGLVSVIDFPVRQAFVTEMVPDDQVANAVALSGTVFSVARIAGPALAAVVIVVWGTGVCFAVNAVSFGGVLVALLFMRVAELRPATVVPRAAGQIRDALRHVRHDAVLWPALVLNAVVGVFAMNQPVVVPLLAERTLHGTAATYSALTVAIGLGAIIGSLATGRMAAPGPALIEGSALGLGVTMVASSLMPGLASMLPLLALVGVTSAAFLVGSNAVVQLSTPTELRGRVLALRTIVVLGSTPIGGPLVGGVCELLGPRWGFGLGGVASAAGAAWHRRSRRAVVARGGPLPCAMLRTHGAS